MEDKHMTTPAGQRQRAEAVVEEFKDAAIDIYEAVEPDSIDQSLFVRFEKALDALDRLAREGVR